MFNVNAIRTALGTITHQYWHENGVYYRRPLMGGQDQLWDGVAWVSVCLPIVSMALSNERLAA